MAPWKLDQRSGAAAWLRAAAERRALPHALLFTGGDGSAAAEFAAAAMECTAEQGRPCGVCHACRKVLSGIHPDVVTVQDPEHKLLSAETVRNVRSDAYIRPNEGERKVYVFPDCALLTEADQNILLKTVEEGPPSAAFLFCAESASAVLPTLRSRCVECKLSPAETEETPPQSPGGGLPAGPWPAGSGGRPPPACVRLERENADAGRPGGLAAPSAGISWPAALKLPLRRTVGTAGKLPRSSRKSLTKPAPDAHNRAVGALPAGLPLPHRPGPGSGRPGGGGGGAPLKTIPGATPDIRSFTTENWRRIL